MPWLFSRRFRSEHPEEVKEIKARMAAGYLSRNSREFQRQLKANVAADNRASNRHIKTPTLIMVGKDDELTPPRLAAELKAEISNSELLVLDQGDMVCTGRFRRCSTRPWSAFF